MQSYWADKHGDVSWIEPDGSVDKKKSFNRKIGYKIYGRTLFRGGVWGETNFENEFDIDTKVHDIVGYLTALKPLSHTAPEFFKILKLIVKYDRNLADSCKMYYVEDRISRYLLLLLCSLLIRSPSNRFKYETFPARFGLAVSEDIGKANMRESYMLAKKLCLEGLMTNRFFVLLHSNFKRFICGDGCLDWLSGSLQANQVSGRALIPLTPNLCIYVSTPTAMRTNRNCASLRAAPWMVERVNEIVQIYSRDQLFFLGRKPQLTDEFRRRQFLEHSNHSADLLQMFDKIAQINSSWNGFSSVNVSV